ncbi:nucleotidyltransferase domain-containing protein [Candidatus Bathyarchaeota archaeon]|nr:nucleotidyltransferase domain-containing protein [Candidatus Bathyarchaeota archaeon]
MLPRERLKERMARKVDEFLNQIKPLKPKLVILFGSYARGDFTENSDIDVCVVAEELPMNIFERRSLSGLYRVYGLRAIGYQPNEFIEMLSEPNLFIHEILSEGIILYCEKSFLETVEKAKLKIVKEMMLSKKKDVWRFKQHS